MWRIYVLFSLLFLYMYIAHKYHKLDDNWEYGTCGSNNRPARKHKKKGNVQFVLWEAGEQGHTEDHWIDFDSSWWKIFKRNKND